MAKRFKYESIDQTGNTTLFLMQINMTTLTSPLFKTESILKRKFETENKVCLQLRSYL